MAKGPITIAVSVLMFCGWVVYLAGVASMTSLCNKVGDGDKTSADLISSGPDSPDKNFLPLLNPWALPVNPTPTTGRKMLSVNDMLFPTHARGLRSVTSDRCGWSYSFEWWTVALGGLGTILAILTSLGILSLLAGAVGPLLIVNTALLCVIASDLMPVASNLTVTETKGDYPNAIFATAAGIIINLIGNFFWFLVANIEEPASHSPEIK